MKLIIDLIATIKLFETILKLLLIHITNDT